MKFPNYLSSRVVAAYAALSLFCPLIASAKPNTHLPKAVAQAKAVAHLAANQQLHLSFSIAPTDAQAIDAFVDSLYDPASPSYHHFVTPQQFGALFGATEQDYAALQDWAKSKGFTVTKTYKNRLTLSVEGSAAAIEKAFKVSMNVYNHPTEARTFFSADQEPTVDAPVALSAIHGLNNFFRPHPHIRKASGLGPKVGSGPGGLFMGNDFRKAYVPGTSLNGHGESIGLLQFDDYYASDIAAYRTKAGLPNIPLTKVPIDGGVPFIGDGNGEVCLDIDMCMSMAPGLTRIYVYEGPPDTAPFMDVIAQMADDNLSRQLSCSWGIGERMDEIEPLFKQMAAQGQSFFDATGDDGALVPPIPFPSDSPSITQVGGTTLNTSGVGSWSSEIVWNWGDFNGSSGGISDVFTIPSYQSGINMSSAKGSTSYRNFPDVALTADNVYIVADDGFDEYVGGTSCAAPLWAGFMALANQRNTASNQPPAGLINSFVYSLGKAKTRGAFHDITSGNNTNDFSDGLWSAVAGFDLCTGWGTPGTNLLNLFYQETSTYADLAMTGTNGPAPATVGAPYVFDYAITNNGALGVTNAVFTATFSSDVGVSSVNVSQGGFSSTSNSVSCLLGTIASNGIAHVTVTITPATIGFLTNTAAITSEVPDPRATNNSITSVAVVNPADLVIGNTAPASVFVGYPFTYTVCVTNFGPEPATNVKVVDVLPAGVTFVPDGTSATQGDFSYDTNSGTVTFSVGYLDVHYITTMTISVRSSTDPQTVANSITVSANEPDPVATNNTATAVTDILSLPPFLYNASAIGYPTAAFVTWNTLSNAPGQVAYGTTTNYGSISTFDSTPRTDHSVLLTGLTPDTVYYYQVTSSYNGAVFSATGSFITTASIIVQELDGFYYGDWTLSSAAGDKFGSYFQYANTTTNRFSPSATAIFNATLPLPGRYDVATWFTSGTNHTRNAQVLVSGAAGSSMTTVDQTVGGRWVSIGTGVNFPDGNASVQLMNNTGETNKTIIANAVKFSYSVGQDKPTDGSVPTWWSQYYFGNTSVSGSIDSDADGYSNFTEYVLGTTPNDPASHVAFSSQKTANGVQIVFAPYQGGRVYKLQYRANFSSPWTTLANTPSVDAKGDGVFTVSSALTGYFRLQASLAP